MFCWEFCVYSSCCGKLCLGMENVFFIGLTTARQMINVVPAGSEPAFFICQDSVLTTRQRYAADCSTHDYPSL